VVSLPWGLIADAYALIMLTAMVSTFRAGPQSVAGPTVGRCRNRSSPW
jgi:hypothetical protein